MDSHEEHQRKFKKDEITTEVEEPELDYPIGTPGYRSQFWSRSTSHMAITVVKRSSVLY